MIDVPVVQDVSFKLVGVDGWSDSPTELGWQPPVTTTVLAQQFDQDILGDLNNAFSTFIDSGQVWALLVGFVLGYLIRGITA